MIAGSSPLARGLPPKYPRAAADPRIIPARAGFTRSTAGTSRFRRDHPRSRGVYPPGRSPIRPTPGSSPLARGLRGHVVTVRSDGGIIPARAGFTQPGTGYKPGDKDHPRSRGVYRMVLIAPEISPWIIPARAGFTLPTQLSLLQEKDHPRSRGVYGDSGSGGRECNGSSPLARGLRAKQYCESKDGGIIPARAGFTPDPRPEDPPAADHPRSRGVYLREKDVLENRGGSSPLARGLLVRYNLTPVEIGIIPARAGFTSRRTASLRSSKDHPRSRGVYCCNEI